MKRIVEHIGAGIIRLKHSDLFKGFAITTIGSGLSKAIMIAATFYCTHTLTQAEFGEFSFVNNTLVMVLTICATNFSRLCTKFATEASSSRESLQRLFFLFLFSLVACVLAGLLILILPDPVLEFVFGDTSMFSFLRFSALLLPLFMLNPLIEGVLRGMMKFRIISIVQVFTAFFYLAALIIGIQIGGVNGAVGALLMYYSIYAIAFFICIIRIVPVASIISKVPGFRAQWRVIPQMVLPVFVASFVEAPMFWALQLLLTKYSTVAAVGGMTVMKQVRNFALLIPTYFFNTYIAFAGKLNADKKYTAYFNQFDKLLNYICWVGIGFFILFSVLCKPILWLYHPEYISLWKCLIISNACIPISLVITLTKTDLILQEHQRLLLYISIVWNIIWLLLFVLLVSLRVEPLEAFFYGELGAMIVQMIGCGFVYKKDKVRLTNNGI